MNAAVEMTPDWRRWEGEIVAGEFPLVQFLGAGERGATFRTRLASGDGAIKLVPAGRVQAEELVERWNRASGLDHPHLIRILKTGTWAKGGVSLAYLVMEYADENLATVLQERALTADETLEMLGPVAETLEFLHGRGFAHGHLTPSNISAVKDILKISSDGVSAGDVSADLRALAATTIQVLTRQAATVSQVDSEAKLIDRLPQVFQEIVRNCAGRNGRVQWSAAQLAGWLRTQQVAPEGATRDEPAAISAPAMRVPRSKSSKVKLTSYAIGLAFILVAVVTVGSLLSHRTADSISPAPKSSEKTPEQTPSANPPTPVTHAAPSPARAKVTKPSATSRETATGSDLATSREAATGSDPATSRGAATSSDPATSREAATGSDPATSRDAATAGDPGPPRESAARRVVGSPGEVVHEVIPEISAKARRTVHGTVDVLVRVAVDPSGRVTDATLESKGSPYFGKLAVAAARKWAFVAADGAAPREWFLRYQITRTDSKVFVEKAAQR